MGNQNFIEINGRRYDTLSGKLIHSSGALPIVTIPVPKTSSQNKGVMDGVSRRPAKSRPHAPTSHLNKSQQKSQTLMRNSVDKPIVALHHQIIKAPVIQKSALGVSARRLTQASAVAKSPQIKKFGTSTARSSVARIQQDTPLRAAPHHAQPLEMSRKVQDTASLNKARTASVTERLINTALASSRSHEELPVHFKKRSKLSRKLGISSKAASVSMAVMAGVLLGGFFAIQNVPNLAMKVAATRAGFNANMPGYNPSGFSFRGPINYTAGKVTINFKSNADERNYSISQSSSNWNSDALLSNYVVANNKTYQTYLDRGRTLYMYDGSSATWIDNGIWYQIEGESSLTTDQLIRIASSL